MTDTDPVAWLREALDAAQHAAERAAELCGCHPPAPSWEFDDEATDGRIRVVDEPHPTLKRKIGRRWNGSYEGLYMAEHIVRHDPAAVLRRIDRDRKTLARHQPFQNLEIVDMPKVGHVTRCAHDKQHWPCPDITDLAEGYGWTEEEQR